MANVEKPGTNPITVARDRVIAHIRSGDYNPDDLQVVYKIYEEKLFGATQDRKKACQQLIEFTSSLITRFKLSNEQKSLEYFSKARQGYRDEIENLPK
jgi:hypothetical protein